MEKSAENPITFYIDTLKTYHNVTTLQYYIKLNQKLGYIS